MRSPATRRVFVSVISVVILIAAMIGPTAARAKSGIKYGGTLTVVQGPKASWTRNFNPSVGSPTDGTQGIIYEPLLIFNQAKGGKIIKWLASGFKWGKGNK